MVTLQATKNDGVIHITEDSFEHLLNCIDNQKFIHEINADALTTDYAKIQQENQDCIDDFNKQCRRVLHEL